MAHLQCLCGPLGLGTADLVNMWYIWTTKWTQIIWFIYWKHFSWSTFHFHFKIIKWTDLMSVSRKIYVRRSSCAGVIRDGRCFTWRSQEEMQVHRLGMYPWEERSQDLHGKSETPDHSMKIWQIRLDSNRYSPTKAFWHSEAYGRSNRGSWMVLLSRKNVFSLFL